MSQVITLSLVFLSLAAFMQLLSVAIPYWTSNSDVHMGLWQACVRGECISIQSHVDYFYALRALETIGLITGVSGILTVVIGKFTKILRPGVARILSATLCIATGAIILIGIIEFCMKNSFMSACFAMSVISAFMFGIIGGRFTVSDEH